MSLEQLLKKVHLRRDELWAKNPALTKEVQDLLRRQQENLTNWMEKAVETLSKKGCQVSLVSTPEKAAQRIQNIVGNSSVVQAYSPLFKPCNLPSILEQNGNEVIETHLGAFTLQILGKNPVHPDFPAGDLEEREILAALSNYFGLSADADKRDILLAARKYLREKAEQAAVGISGVSAIIAEHGSIVLGEDSGQVRAVSNLPPVHIAIVDPSQIVPTLDDAIHLLRYQAINSYGRDIQNYLSIVTGPSRTADIEFKMVNGVHGPGEVHVLIIRS